MKFIISFLLVAVFITCKFFYLKNDFQQPIDHLFLGRFNLYASEVDHKCYNIYAVEKNDNNDSYNIRNIFALNIQEKKVKKVPKHVSPEQRATGNYTFWDAIDDSLEAIHPHFEFVLLDRNNPIFNELLNAGKEYWDKDYNSYITVAPDILSNFGNYKNDYFRFSQLNHRSDSSTLEFDGFKIDELLISNDELPTIEWVHFMRDCIIGLVLSGVIAYMLRSIRINFTKTPKT